MVDWILAGKIAGIGFLTVFIVLAVLSLVLWIVSLLLYRVFRKRKVEEAAEDSSNA
jgi:Na+-transporting methylmalonyl-CoA/oxaloacetate decarboxylase gamma subunit